MWKIKASIGDILLAVLFALIVYKGTGGVFLYPTELVCIFLVVLFCRSQKSQSGYFIKTHHGIFDVYFFLLLVLMMLSSLTSYSRSASMPFLIRFIMFFLLYQFIFNVDKMAFLLEVMSKYAAFIAAVYVVCYPFFGRDTGILRSYQHTGLSMSIALGIYVAKYFANTSFKRTDYLFALIVLLALMVTGKRTLFVLPVIEYFFLFFSMREKDKYKKTSRIFILCLLVLPVLLLVIPSARNAVLRIIEGFGDKTLSHRTYIWAYAEMMWASKPIFGWGFGTMPYHISHAGVDLMAYGAITETGAHNIYLQMLAEIGIVGCVAFCVFFAGYLIYSVRQVRRMKESWSNQEKMVAYLSLIWQVWFLGYGFTGNPLYMVDECWVYFMALTLMNSVCSRQQKALRIRLK